MAEYVLWTRIERKGGAFVARVTAVPRGVPQRTAPEERRASCLHRHDACAAAQRLAQVLAHDIRARGNRVVVPERPGSSICAPPEANGRHAAIHAAVP